MSAANFIRASALFLLMVIAKSLPKKKIEVHYPVELLPPLTGPHFSGNVTGDKLTCFGNRDYPTPTINDAVLCLFYLPLWMPYPINWFNRVVGTSTEGNVGNSMTDNEHASFDSSPPTLTSSSSLSSSIYSSTFFRWISSSSSCSTIWGSRSVVVETTGSVEFFRLPRLPHESGFDMLTPLNVTRWMEILSTSRDEYQREIRQIPAEPTYLCARSSDWNTNNDDDDNNKYHNEVFPHFQDEMSEESCQSSCASFTITFRPGYLRNKDRDESINKIFLHMIFVLATSSVWFLPYVAAFVCAVLSYIHGIKIFIAVFVFSSSIVCLAPLMLTRKNRHLARLYISYFFTRIQAEETKMVIRQRLPVFQAIFFSSVLVCTGSMGSYFLYSYCGIDRETRNILIKITISMASSWFVFVICRSFERFFRDWIWVVMSVGLTRFLDVHINPLSRDRMFFAIMCLTYAFKWSANRIMKRLQRSPLLTSAKSLQKISSYLFLPPWFTNAGSRVSLVGGHHHHHTSSHLQRSHSDMQLLLQVSTSSTTISSSLSLSSISKDMTGGTTSACIEEVNVSNATYNIAASNNNEHESVETATATTSSSFGTKKHDNVKGRERVAGIDGGMDTGMDVDTNTVYSRKGERVGSKDERDNDNGNNNNNKMSRVDAHDGMAKNIYKDDDDYGDNESTSSQGDDDDEEEEEEEEEVVVEEEVGEGPYGGRGDEDSSTTSNSDNEDEDEDKYNHEADSSFPLFSASSPVLLPLWKSLNTLTTSDILLFGKDNDEDNRQDKAEEGGGEEEEEEGNQINVGDGVVPAGGSDDFHSKKRDKDHSFHKDISSQDTSLPFESKREESSSSLYSLLERVVSAGSLVMDGKSSAASGGNYPSKKNHNLSLEDLNRMALHKTLGGGGGISGHRLGLEVFNLNVGAASSLTSNSDGSVAGTGNSNNLHRSRSASTDDTEVYEGKGEKTSSSSTGTHRNRNRKNITNQHSNFTHCIGHMALPLHCHGPIVVDGSQVWLPLATHADRRMLRRLQEGCHSLHNGTIRAMIVEPVEPFRCTANLLLTSAEEASALKAWMNQSTNNRLLKNIMATTLAEFMQTEEAEERELDHNPREVDGAGGSGVDGSKKNANDNGNSDNSVIGVRTTIRVKTVYRKATILVDFTVETPLLGSFVKRQAKRATQALLLGVLEQFPNAEMGCGVECGDVRGNELQPDGGGGLHVVVAEATLDKSSLSYLHCDRNTLLSVHSMIKRERHAGSGFLSDYDYDDNGASFGIMQLLGNFTHSLLVALGQDPRAARDASSCSFDLYPASDSKHGLRVVVTAPLMVKAMKATKSNTTRHHQHTTTSHRSDGGGGGGGGNMGGGGISSDRSHRIKTAASTCYSLLVGDMVAFESDNHNHSMTLGLKSSSAPSRALAAGFTALYIGALAAVARDRISTSLLLASSSPPTPRGRRNNMTHGKDAKDTD